jgi:hypothetical protein
MGMQDRNIHPPRLGVLGDAQRQIEGVCSGEECARGRGGRRKAEERGAHLRYAQTVLSYLLMARVVVHPSCNDPFQFQH